LYPAGYPVPVHSTVIIWGRILTGLEEQVKQNQRRVMECVEKIDSLYERLQLNMNDKFQFLAEHQG
jgi:hypothetical protein